VQPNRGRCDKLPPPAAVAVRVAGETKEQTDKQMDSTLAFNNSKLNETKLIFYGTKLYMHVAEVST